jgi:putative lipoic acid-binding regulatory protein
MDHRPSEDLLNSTHTFPGVYQFKAIGKVEGDFQSRVLNAVRSEVVSRSEVDHSVRSTPDGRHVAVTLEAVTLEVTVQNAEQVRSIYAKIRHVEGLLFLI